MTAHTWTLAAVETGPLGLGLMGIVAATSLGCAVLALARRRDPLARGVAFGAVMGIVAMLRGMPHLIFASLSGGEKARVQMAKLMPQGANFLLLDEPTNHLDIHNQLDTLRFVRRLGITVVAALHDLNLAAMFCDRLCALSMGKVVAVGTPDEVLTEKFLAEVEGVVLATMLSKLSGVAGGNVSAVDNTSRFYVLWRFIYKTAELDADVDERILIDRLPPQFVNCVLRNDEITRITHLQWILLLPGIQLRPPGTDLWNVFIRDHRIQALQHFLDVCHDRNVCHLVLMDFAWIDVDVHHLTVLGKLAQFARHAVVESNTECQQKVSVVNGIV